MADQILWGDMHCNVHRKHMHTLEQTYEAAREHLDFFPIAYYPADFYQTMEGLRVESCGPRPTFERDWQRVCELTNAYHEPGRFVTFPGYEWSGDRTRYGDHNIFYFDQGPLDLSEDVRQLFANLKRRRAIAIPHHTAYQVGQRGKDWDIHDEELSPVAEIYSRHGSSEGCNTPFSLIDNAAMAPRVSGGSIQDGLRRGYRFGIFASNDSHDGVAGVWGLGLVAALAPEPTREALWGALKARRVYGVTGDRIQIDFTANGQPMGSVVRAGERPQIRVGVVGSQALDRIEVLRNNRVVYTHCHSGSWDLPARSELVRVKLKMECGWGPTPQYNFPVGPKLWEGDLSLSAGRLLSVEPSFTHWGQKLGPVAETTCHWRLTTAPWQVEVTPDTRQALIFEIEAPSDAPLTLRANGLDLHLSLAEAMEKSRVVAFLDEVKALVWERFQLRPEEIENGDAFYHNAYKMKLHVAVPRAGYATEFEWVDEKAPAGRNWYYLRISQLNGQMAWSSPIWFEPD